MKDSPVEQDLGVSEGRDGHYDKRKRVQSLSWSFVTGAIQSD